MKEEFKEIVVRQYFDVISNLIIECESLSQLNSSYCDLDRRVRMLISAAKRDGLEESIIWEIVTLKLPDYYEKTAFCTLAA
jgi:hypothetical protein